MIKQGHRLLVIRRPEGDLGFPAGTTRSAETAQCTAHRETWEETGENVLVGSLLHIFNDFPATFYLYRCYVEAGTGDSDEAFVPCDQQEVEEVLWIEPERVDPHSWRFPTQYETVKQIFYNIEE